MLSFEYLQPGAGQKVSAERIPVHVIAQTPKTEHAVYLKGLNGLRAIAVMAVLATHILQEIKIKVQTGAFGVTVFFTLSGFLITYLLLLEHKKTGTISLAHFYTRRVLRISALVLFILTHCVDSRSLVVLRATTLVAGVLQCILFSRCIFCYQ